jgi:apolipoprotein N-acyltransferase
MAALSGVLQVLPFPIAGPLPAWRAVICWFALTPLLMALTASDAGDSPIRIRDGAALGYCSGFIWYLGNCYWIFRTMHYYGGISQPVSAGILLLFCLYLGLYHAVFGALIVVVRRGPLGHNGALALSPFIWVAVELARSRVTGFPWDLLGMTQIDNLPLMHLAPITGVYGVSFVIAAINASWLLRITVKQRRYTRPLLASAFVAIFVLYLAFLRYAAPPVHEDSQAVATLVQQDLGVGAPGLFSGAQLTEEEKLREFSRLSLFPSMSYCAGIPELSSTKCIHVTSETPENSFTDPAPAGLIVWPEAPNDFFERDPEVRAALSSLARAAHAPVIAGDIGVDPNPAAPNGYYLYNSAEFIRSDGSLAGRYDKMHLVPFGEYTPYKNLLFFAGSLLQNVGVFEPGRSRKVFRAGGHTYGTFICYESIFPDEIRRFVGLGAEVLVNISDDGWYGDTSAAWEHLNMVRMRAIENHRWVLRATNTGVTAAIDPYGRVVMAAPRNQRTSLRVTFNYERDITFYTAHGDWFAWLCALVTAAVLAYGLTRAKSSRPAVSQ